MTVSSQNSASVQCSAVCGGSTFPASSSSHPTSQPPVPQSLSLAIAPSPSPLSSASPLVVSGNREHSLSSSAAPRHSVCPQNTPLSSASKPSTTLVPQQQLQEQPTDKRQYFSSNTIPSTHNIPVPSPTTPPISTPTPIITPAVASTAPGITTASAITGTGTVTVGATPVATERRGRPRGHRHSQESRRKIGLANRGNIPWNKGRPHSEATKRKIAENTRRAMLRPELRQILKQRALGRRHSEETKLKIGRAARLVRGALQPNRTPRKSNPLASSSNTNITSQQQPTSVDGGACVMEPPHSMQKCEQVDDTNSTAMTASIVVSQPVSVLLPVSLPSLSTLPQHATVAHTSAAQVSDSAPLPSLVAVSVKGTADVTQQVGAASLTTISRDNIAPVPMVKDADDDDDADSLIASRHPSQCHRASHSPLRQPQQQPDGDQAQCNAQEESHQRAGNKNSGKEREENHRGRRSNQQHAQFSQKQCHQKHSTGKRQMSQQARQKLSRRMKEMWTDPAYRSRVSTGIEIHQRNRREKQSAFDSALNPIPSPNTSPLSNTTVQQKSIALPDDLAPFCFGSPPASPCNDDDDRFAMDTEGRGLSFYESAYGEHEDEVRRGDTKKNNNSSDEDGSIVPHQSFKTRVHPPTPTLPHTQMYGQDRAEHSLEDAFTHHDFVLPSSVLRSLSDDDLGLAEFHHDLDAFMATHDEGERRQR